MGERRRNRRGKERVEGREETRQEKSEWRED